MTTDIDRVPQLSANSSSIQFVDVDQVEFVRGPQAALFGRNALGGMIHITSRPPSEQREAEINGSFGNYNLRSGTFRFSGPLEPGKRGVSLAGGYSERD